MYLDSAYIAKYYVNEADSGAVRKLIRSAKSLNSSGWALIEVSCVFQRHVREGSIEPDMGTELVDLFRSHVESGYWELLPVTESLLRSTATLIRRLPKEVHLRAGDAVHIASALHLGESTIWTNDRHLLKAASYFGLTGRSVSSEPV